MKKVAFLTTAIIVFAVSVASGDPYLANWLAQAQSTPGNVTADATGWTFDGTAGVPYDYGVLGHDEGTVEYIFNLSDSDVSVALGSVYGWGTERNAYKLEQWSDQGVFGLTIEGIIDTTFPSAASTFDVDTHVVFVNHPDHTQEIFVNGASQGFSTRTSGWYTNGGAGFLGSTSWGADIAVGTIYGVASYDRALTASEVSDVYDAYVLTVQVRAGRPLPANNETDVCTKAVLGWTPGAYADKHDVYFGTSETQVTDSDRDNPLGVLVSQDQDASHYPIAGALALDFETTYYWRIDEVNAAPDYDIHKGSVWQFTTEPLSYQLPNDRIAATADSNGPDQGPENTINGSGLSDDLHSKDAEAMWLSASGASQPNWIEYKFDKVYRLREMWVWNHNTTHEKTVGFGVKNATVQYSIDGENYSTLGTTHEFTQAPGTDGYAHNTEISFEGIAAQYVRITANSNWGDGLVEQYGLSEVRFFYSPMQARQPEPENEAVDVVIDVTLNWREGREAATHEVYFSSDRRAVADGTVSPASIPAGAECRASYTPSSLELGKTYYWKVDEVNLAEEPNTWEGDVWSFSTPEYVVVEDFEGYSDDEGEEVFATWEDGFGVSGNGSQISHNSTPWLEDANVHGGSWSAPYYFDNTGTVMNSEVKRMFDSPQNWSTGGIRALTLFFYGQTGNTTPSTGEQMYVKLNDVKVAYDGDMADITQEQWHQWDIDLALFGVNLANVTTISIGFDRGASPASGLVFFDDIRLYPARCRASILKPSADLDDDCRVNYQEVDIISANWLIGAYEVTPAAPDDANLAGHWTFDNALDLGADSTGNNTGTVGGNASQSIDAKVGSGALALDGDGDFINVGGGPFFSALDDNGDGFTVAAWVKFVHTLEFSLMRIFSTDMSITGSGWGFGFIQPPARLRFTTFGIRDYDAGRWMSSYLPDNSQWIHVAAVYKSDGDVDFYVDGMWIETVAGDFSLNDTDGFLIGGLASETSPEWFEGVIDDLRIYNNELSHGQVGWLANQSVPYIQDISPLLTPQNPDIDWSGDGMINFGDFAGLMQQWLDELLWP